MEIWKDIPGYGGYEASNAGRIRSKRKGHVLSASPNNKGYMVTTVSHNGKPRRLLVHRLVMAAFHGQSLLQVNHGDGDKRNNRLDNLEYMTNKQNIQHAINTLGVRYGGNRMSTREVKHERS